MKTHDWLLGASPMQTASSASWTCNACRSIVEWTATHGIPISWAVLITRTAISPRLATRIFWYVVPRADDLCCPSLSCFDRTVRSVSRDSYAPLPHRKLLLELLIFPGTMILVMLLVDVEALTRGWIRKLVEEATDMAIPDIYKKMQPNYGRVRRLLQ